MANEQNLILKDSAQSREEAQRNGRKGGIASGKARRERRALKETLETLLAMPLKGGKCADLETIKNVASLKGKNITVQEAIMVAQVQKALKGDIRSAEYIREIIGDEDTRDNSLEIIITKKTD